MTNTITPTLLDQRWGPNSGDLFDYYKNPTRVSGGNPVLLMRHGGGGLGGTHAEGRNDDVQGDLFYLLRWLSGFYTTLGSSPTVPWDLIQFSSGQHAHISFGGHAYDNSPVNPAAALYPPAAARAMFFPDAIRDCQRAIAAIKSLHASLDDGCEFDPDNVVLIGSSFGATLAALSQCAPPLRGNGSGGVWSDGNYASCAFNSRARGVFMHLPQVKCAPDFITPDNYASWFGIPFGKLDAAGVSVGGDALTWTEATKKLAWTNSTARSVGVIGGTDRVYLLGGIRCNAPGFYDIASVVTGDADIRLSTSIQASATPFTISNCTWQNSTRTLSTVTAGAFSNVANGAAIEVVSGTGVDQPGSFTITSHTSTTCVISGDINTEGNLATGDIVARSGTVYLCHHIDRLPANIRKMASIMSYFEDGDTAYIPSLYHYAARQGYGVKPYVNPHDSAQFTDLETVMAAAGATLSGGVFEAGDLDASATYPGALPSAAVLAVYQQIDDWLSARAIQ